MTLKVDKTTITKILDQTHPKIIAFNAPDGLLPLTRRIALELETEYNLSAIVISDPSYGSCDTVDTDAQRLGAEVAFHIGHTVTVKKFGKITYAIDAFDDVSFDRVTTNAGEVLRSRNFKSVGLVAFAQHLQELPKVAGILERDGFVAVIGKGLGQLHDGQIFGCEFYPAHNIRDKVDAMFLLGPSMFHAIGLCLSTGKPTYMLDPYQNEVIDVQKTADERLKRAVLSIYKARDARNLGIIIGLKEGQIMSGQSIRLKAQLEKYGKQVQLVALREITPERLNAMTEIEAFVQTGCPRISVDGYTFSKPVLSVPQTDALINLLSGREVSMDLFERKNWL
ncbi:MAG: diphthamide biosynthesis enzyme Dph2 [Nitrososphaerota archaeon]|nr:diphthamide biosynthesis enzyme Dph2 [Nitrososphaerota archaeon]